MCIDTYDGPSEFSSTNLEFEGEEDDHHVVEGVHLVQTSPRPQCSPIIESTTTTTPKTTTTDNKFSQETNGMELQMMVSSPDLS